MSGVRVVYVWCTRGVRVVYAWCTRDVCVVYVWCTCVYLHCSFGARLLVRVRQLSSLSTNSSSARLTAELYQTETLSSDMIIGQAKELVLI